MWVLQISPSPLQEQRSSLLSHLSSPLVLSWFRETIASVFVLSGANLEMIFMTKRANQVRWYMPITTALGRCRQDNQEFKVHLGFTARLKLGWATWINQSIKTKPRKILA